MAIDEGWIIVCVFIMCRVDISVLLGLLMPHIDVASFLLFALKNLLPLAIPRRLLSDEPKVIEWLLFGWTQIGILEFYI